MKKGCLFFLTILFLLIFAASGLSQDIKTTVGGHVAALHEHDLDTAIRLASSGDRAAFEKFVDGNPTVIVLKAGIRVYVEQVKIRGSKIKIRPVGETVTMWTVYRAVE